MHKSWGNMIEFNEAADEMGVDVMRWMYANHKPETDLLFGYHRADETRRRFLIPLWNVYSFFVTYANLDNWQPASVDAPLAGVQLSELDRWILARLNQVIAQVTVTMDEYDPYAATLALEPLLDDLTNWYVRRSRRRFWKSEHDADKDAAYATLYHVLVTLAKLLAPLVPFVSEVMYQNLVRSVDEGTEESVHHNAWPEVDEAAVDRQLLDQMGLAMRIAALGRSARSTSNVKLRQPLARARVYAGEGPSELPGSLVELVTEELNVKELEFVDSEADLVEYEIGLLPNLLGPKHGPRFPRVRQAVAAAGAAALARRFRAGLSVTVEMPDGGPPVELLPEEVEVRTHGREGYAVAEDRGLVVAVDVTISPELAREGLARDLVRRIQTLRKEAGFDLDDRITTYYDTTEEVAEVVVEWADYVRAETLSVDLVSGLVPEGVDRQESFNLAGEPVTLGVKRIGST
jgi:isoleucyl-tRNA synthetase